MSETADITIIGGGAVGCAIAYELSRHSDKEIFLIEKNSNFRGENQSGRNSGVIHAGIYYPKADEPLKSRLCVEGNGLLYEFCEDHGVPYRKTGKIVVATDDREEEYLDDVLATAAENGVQGVELLTGDEVRVLEPNVRAKSALYVPTSGIIEPTEYLRILHYLADECGVMSVPGTEVVDIWQNGSIFEVTTKSGNHEETFQTRRIINAAGLYSDEIARMVNPDSEYKMAPVRGEIAKFYKTRREDIFMSGMNVYPAPHGIKVKTGKDVKLNFDDYQTALEDQVIVRTVGVHLTPTFDKTITIGPLSTVGVDKEDYSAGLWPEEEYLEKVKEYFPNLRLDDIELHQAGVQARLKGHRDFIIEKDPANPNCINLLGIDSPGLTASLAIAKYVRRLMKY